MPMLSFGNRQRGKTIVLAEVEGSSAAVAMATQHGALPLTILISERVALPIGERGDTQLVGGIPGILKEATDRVLKKYAEHDRQKMFGPPKSIYVIVGAPWTRARTISAETRYPEPRPITHNMIQALAQEAIKQPTETDLQSLLETGVVRVHINGYPTGKPIGKRGTHLAVTAYQSGIESSILSSIQLVFGGAFPGRSLEIRSRTRAILNVLQERSLNQCLVVSLGTESTECIAVRKDEIAEHATVPEGETTIIKRIAGEKGLPEESISLLRMLASDTCATPQCQELRAGLARAEPEMMKIFGETFGTLATTRKLPNNCILFAHADFAPWLEHFFGRLDFAPFTMTTQPLSVESITPEHLRENSTWEAGVREDTGIGLAAAFVQMSNQST